MLLKKPQLAELEIFFLTLNRYILCVCIQKSKSSQTANTYLHLQLALKFLSAPNSSVPSDINSNLAVLGNCARITLLQNNHRKLLFLQYNPEAIGFNSINLKCPYRNINDEHQQIIKIMKEVQIVKVAVMSIKLP